MARRITRKEMKHDDFVEAAFDFGHWVEENWQKVVGGAVAVTILIVGIYGFRSWRADRAESAARLLAEGMASYQEAMRADDPARMEQARDALRQSAEQASGSSPVGEIARYVQGLTEIEGGESEQALTLIKQVADGDGPPALVGTARARLAAAYAAGGDTEQAITLWRQLADDPDGFYPQSQAMLSMARLLDRSGREAEAEQVFSDLVRDHPQSSAARAAETRLESP